MIRNHADNSGQIFHQVDPIKVITIRALNIPDHEIHEMRKPKQVGMDRDKNNDTPSCTVDEKRKIDSWILR